jgi:hypothetical protein
VRQQIITDVKAIEFSGKEKDYTDKISTVTGDIVKGALKDSVLEGGGTDIDIPGIGTIQVHVEKTSDGTSFGKNYFYNNPPFGNQKVEGESVYLKGTGPFPITSSQIVPGAEGGVWPMQRETIMSMGTGYEIQLIIIGQIGPVF